MGYSDNSTQQTQVRATGTRWSNSTTSHAVL